MAFIGHPLPPVWGFDEPGGDPFLSDDAYLSDAQDAPEWQESDSEQEYGPQDRPEPWRKTRTPSPAPPYPPPLPPWQRGVRTEPRPEEVQAVCRIILVWARIHWRWAWRTWLRSVPCRPTAAVGVASPQ